MKLDITHKISAHVSVQIYEYELEDDELHLKIINTKGQYQEVRLKMSTFKAIVKKVLNINKETIKVLYGE
jgi:hypothetical protein